MKMLEPNRTVGSDVPNGKFEVPVEIAKGMLSIAKRRATNIAMSDSRRTAPNAKILRVFAETPALLCPKNGPEFPFPFHHGQVRDTVRHVEPHLTENLDTIEAMYGPVRISFSSDTVLYRHMRCNAMQSNATLMVQ